MYFASALFALAASAQIALAGEFMASLKGHKAVEGREINERQVGRCITGMYSCSFSGYGIDGCCPLTWDCVVGGCDGICTSFDLPCGSGCCPEIVPGGTCTAGFCYWPGGNSAEAV